MDERLGRSSGPWWRQPPVVIVALLVALFGVWRGARWLDARHRAQREAALAPLRAEGKRLAGELRTRMTTLVGTPAVPTPLGGPCDVPAGPIDVVTADVLAWLGGPRGTAAPWDDNWLVTPAIAELLGAITPESNVDVWRTYNLRLQRLLAAPLLAVLEPAQAVAARPAGDRRFTGGVVEGELVLRDLATGRERCRVAVRSAATVAISVVQRGQASADAMAISSAGKDAWHTALAATLASVAPGVVIAE